MPTRGLWMDGLPLVGGSLSLDLANTIDWRETERAHDWLATYEDLVRWGLHAGALEGPAAAARIRARATAEPAAARSALDQAHALREGIYGVASAVAGSRPVPPKALAALNDHAFALIAETRLRRVAGGFVRTWAGAEDAPARVLWPVAWSAVEMLSGGEVNRLRECANADCRWLFVDRSRNRSRRWCDMRNCGNVMKARRHRRRRAEGLEGHSTRMADANGDGPYQESARGRST